MSLTGLKAIEFAGLAPGPMAGMILADYGASVTRIDRPFATSNDVLCRGKRSIIVDSKVSSGQKLLRDMIRTADVVIDPFRPGVMERMGLGPGVFFGDAVKKGLNEKLIYARIVGFPRTGPQKDMAGHDINYIALSGVLSLMPGAGKPVFPLNLLGDFAGGGVMCAMGILLALIERGKSGKGQIVDADMVTGARYVSTFILLQSMFPSGIAGGKRGTNALDGGAPFYNVYTCKDGGWMSVGCLEPQFFKTFIKLFDKALPTDFSKWKPTLSIQGQREEWPKLAEYLEKGFLTNTRDYWTRVFHGSDACTVPVLSPTEADSQNVPGPHPNIMSQNTIPGKPPITSANVLMQPGLHTREVLRDMGLGETEVKELVEDGAVMFASKSSHVSGAKL